MIRGKNNKTLESFCTQIALQMSLNSHSTLKKPKCLDNAHGCDLCRRDNQGFMLKEKSLASHKKNWQVNAHVF